MYTRIKIDERDQWNLIFLHDRPASKGAGALHGIELVQKCGP